MQSENQSLVKGNFVLVTFHPMYGPSFKSVYTSDEYKAIWADNPGYIAMHVFNARGDLITQFSRNQTR